jgi:hypothetical protein
MVLAPAILLIGCSRDRPSVTRVDPTVYQPGISSSGFAVNEVIEIAAHMMPGLLSGQFVQQRVQEGAADSSRVPRILMRPVNNNTRFPLPQGVFENRLRSELNKQAIGRIFFIDRSDLDALLAEARLRGESGVTSADFYLTGDIDGITSPGGAGGSQESYLYAFRLVDTRSQIIIWEDNYTISKIAMQRIVDR